MRVLGYALIFILITIACFWRFSNLNWGEPFFFHPDERNIASSVSQLKFPTNLHPHFFAYGTFPIYVIYVSSLLWKALQPIVSFETAILVSRAYSAILSILLTIFVFIVGKQIKNTTTALFAFTLSIFSVGLIQFAHLGTFEMWLSFEFLLLFYFLNKFLSTKKRIYGLGSSVTLGLLLSTKVSSFAIVPLFASAIVFAYRKRLCSLVSHLLLFFFVASGVFISTSPFAVLDYPGFFSSIQYEASVALGRLPVFYTEVFIGAIPVVFQFTHVYPFLFNPILSFLLIPSFLYVSYVAFKRRDPGLFLLVGFFASLFFSQAFLFAKWTRYMVPTLPFAYLMIAISVSDFLRLLTKKYNDAKTQPARYCNYISIIAVSVIGVVSIGYALSYVITVHLKKDVRIQAAQWAKNHISLNASIATEAYDLGILPFNSLFSNITLLNTYQLEQDDIVPNLETFDYIILPSQRVITSRLINPNVFPKGHSFYQNLFDEKSGFKKVYETPCDLWCNILYLGDPTFRFEQTANIFDRPQVLIFKRV